MSDTQSYIQQNKQRFLDELIELLKIASISADPAYNQDVLNCADAVAKHLANAGADQVEICETKGYPVVYGEKIINPELPTVLVYGHYRDWETDRESTRLNSSHSAKSRMPSSA